ncbi:MAG: 2Fe-2S iron-sulfur cluster-binding protein, partial [Deltaproteobacteria bacterium]|nr:2Fe-2S iron-sulfur cluster-binding protein [Deltaproteobacteria bacterium]
GFDYNNSMPKVTFVTENLIVEAEGGATLRDVVDGSASQFPFGCRMGSCGTCRCIVEEGMENLNPMSDKETTMFENFTSVGQNERLGCQLQIFGNVKIRA